MTIHPAEQLSRFKKFIHWVDFKRPVTPRSRGMLFLGVIALAHGWGYHIADTREAPLPPGLTLIVQVLPVEFWAILWLIAGIGAVWSALYKPMFKTHPIKNIFMSSLIAMFTLWGLAYSAGYVIQPIGRQWVVGILYLGVAGHIYYTRQLVSPLPLHTAAEVPPYRQKV